VNALDEARDVALARSTQYQQNLQNYHSRRVRPRSFVDGHGKLESPWLEPYVVTEVIPVGAYRLRVQLHPRVHAHTHTIFWVDKYFSNFKCLMNFTINLEHLYAGYDCQLCCQPK
jgi:hypothetical protein